MTNMKKTKRALLSSVVSLILCFSMLLGTTYAWFTDSVSNGANTIQSGNLDVELHHIPGHKYVDVNSWNSEAAKPVEEETELFLNKEDKPILWEPGAGAQEYFRISNAGSLALKYQFKIQAGNIKIVDGKDLSDVLSVIVDTIDVNGDVADTETYNFKEGMTIGNSLERDGEHIYRVTIEWKHSDKDNEYNVKDGLSLDLGIILLATQLANEEDGFDSSYDEGAKFPEVALPINSVEELNKAFAQGGEFVLGDDLSFDETLEVPEGVDLIIDLAGNTITANNEGAQSAITIDGNVTFVNTSDETAGIVAVQGDLAGDLVPAIGVSSTGVLNFDDGKIAITGTGLSAGIIAENGVVNFNGGTVTVCGGGSSYGIMAVNNAEINMNAGEIIVNAPDASEAYGILSMWGTAAVNLNGGKITVKTPGEYHYGVYVLDGTMNLSISDDFVFDVVEGAHKYGALLVGGLNLTTVSKATQLPTNPTELEVKTNDATVTMSSDFVDMIKVLKKDVTSVALTHSEAKVEDGKVSFDFIELVDQNGNIIELDGTSTEKNITVTLTLPANHNLADNATVGVYHDGVLMDVATVSGDKITYSASHFCEVEVVPGNFVMVKTSEDLLKLSAKALTGNNSTAEEAIIVIGADIDMQGADFSAIIAQRGDKLTVLGKGHKISNVNIVSGANDNTTGQASMFYAYPNSTLTVSDLTLEDITVTADADGSGYAAAVIGYCEGAAILNNVDVVNATITGVKSSGMLVGHLSGSLTATDCELSGTVTLAAFAEEANGHYAAKYIGTLAGAANMTNCSANVTVSGNLNAANLGEVYGRKTAAGSSNVEFAKDQTEFDAAIKAGINNIILAADTNVTIASGAVAGKDITITGDKSSTVVLVNTNPGYEGKLSYQDGANLTFKGITFDANQISGICARGGAVTFIDCFVTGELEQTIANKFVFSGCTFDVGVTQVGYGCTDVVFEGCVFETDGYGIKLYKEANEKFVNLTVKDCSFKNTGSNARSAILLDHILDGFSYNITVEGCTFEGYTETPTATYNKWAERMIVTDSFVQTADGQYIFSYQTGVEGGNYHKLLTSDKLVVTVK